EVARCRQRVEVPAPPLYPASAGEQAMSPAAAISGSPARSGAAARTATSAARTRRRSVTRSIVVEAHACGRARFRSPIPFDVERRYATWHHGGGSDGAIRGPGRDEAHLRRLPAHPRRREAARAHRRRALREPGPAPTASARPAAYLLRDRDVPATELHRR